MKRRIALAAWLIAWAVILLAQGEPIAINNVESKIKDCWQLILKDRESTDNLAQQILTFSKNNQYRKGEAESSAIFGVLAMHSASWKEATNLLNQSLNIWKELGNNKEAGKIALKLAAVKNWQGDYEEAFDYLQQSSQLLEDASGSTKAYENLITGNQLMDAGDFLAAKDRYLMALQIFKNEANNLGIAIANYELGNLNYHQDNIDQAIGYINESLAFFQAENITYYRALANNVLGGIYLEKDNFELAKKAFRESFRQGEIIKDSLLQHDAYINLSVVAYYEEKYEEAIMLADSSALFLKEKGGLPDKKYLYEHYTDIYREMDRHEQVNQYLDSLIIINKAMFNEEVAKAKEQLLAGSEIFSELESLQKEKLELLKKINDDDQQKLKRLGQLRLVIVALVAFILLLGVFIKFIRQRAKSSLLVLQQREMRHQHEIKNIIQESKEGTTKAHLEGQKKERSRIAAILHDRLGSQLAAIKWSIEANMDEMPSSSVREPMAQTLKVLDDTHKDLKVIVRDLEKNDFDLKSQVESFLSYIENNKKIETQLYTYGLSEKMDRDLSEFAFDTLLQLIANVLQHADAKKLSVEINRVDQELNLMVEDDGKGFSEKIMDVKNLQGSGLRNLKTRLAEKNGSLHIDSKPGKGTTINIVIPT